MPKITIITPLELKSLIHKNHNVLTMPRELALCKPIKKAPVERGLFVVISFILDFQLLSELQKLGLLDAVLFADGGNRSVVALGDFP